jgi:hypothetical protein
VTRAATPKPLVIAVAAGGGIRGGQQHPLFRGGNAYLAREFPRLDYIRGARVIRSAAR